MSDIRPDQLDALFAALADGSISDADAATLASTLRDDPAAQDAYLDYLELHSTLAWSLTTPRPIALTTTPTPHADAKPAPGEASGTTYPIYRKGHEPKPTRIHPAYYAIAAVAAALLAACGLAVYLLTTSVDPKPIAPPNQHGPSVATLIQNTGDLRTPADFPVEGESSGPGEYTLTTGTAEFMLTNAVNVKLRGETRMVMRNDMNVSLTRGAAAFVCPKDAIGFTVNLPDGSKVVDLGTAFSVRIDDDGSALVRVIDGKVRCIPADGTNEPVELVAGYEARMGSGSVVAARHTPWFETVFDDDDAKPSAGIVSEHGLEFRGLATSGGSLVLQGMSHTFITLDRASGDTANSDGLIGRDGTTVWLSFLIQSESPEAEGFAGLTLFGGGEDIQAHSRLNLARAYQQKFWTASLGESNRSEGYTPQPIELPATPAAGQPELHWWVVRLDFAEGRDTATVFIDPDPSAPLPTTPNAVVSANDLSFDRFRLASTTSNRWHFDEIRIGDTWESVAPIDRTTNTGNVSPKLPIERTNRNDTQ